MKTVSLRELHESTGSIVRRAAIESTVITDRGKPVAVIKSLSPADLPGKPFPKGHWEAMNSPVSKGDSTEIISEMRDR